MMADFPDLILIGGGGHARVLLDALALSVPDVRIAIIDRDQRQVGQRLMGVPIVGDDSSLATLKEKGAKYFVVAMGGARGAVDNAPRSALFDGARALGLEPFTVVHPSAVVSRWAEVAAGCQILPGSIINAGAILGRNVIVNSGAIIEHDCIVGDHAHVATGARIASTVSIGEGAHIGAGAVVRQLITVGAHAIVGAGAVVVRDVRSHAVVAGVPAKELRK